jgi:hypothetical protein
MKAEACKEGARRRGGGGGGGVRKHGPRTKGMEQKKRRRGRLEIIYPQKKMIIII